MAAIFICALAVFTMLRDCVSDCNLETDEDRFDSLYSAWRQEYPRAYSSADEDAERRSLFVLSVRRADEHARRYPVEDTD